MKQYGLIGEKLGHSLSVPIHEAIWEKISLEASYRLIEIPRGELAVVVPELLCTLDGFHRFLCKFLCVHKIHQAFPAVVFTAYAIGILLSRLFSLYPTGKKRHRYDDIVTKL